MEAEAAVAKKHKKKWIVLGLVCVVAVAIATASLRGPFIGKDSYLVINLEGSYDEGAPGGLFSRLLGENRPFYQLIENLAKARHDDRIAGVVVRIGRMESGWAQAKEIRDSLTSLTSAGKTVVAFLRADHFGSNLEYYVASAAPRIYIPPAASPMLKGLSARFVFLGGVWEKIDIAMEVEQLREYKTAGDTIARRSMSRAHREMANSILDDVNAHFIHTLATARDLTPQEVGEIIEACPASPEAFRDAGLADEVLFFDQVMEVLAGNDRPTARAGDIAVSWVDESTYSKVRPQRVGLGGPATVAVVHIAGTLVTGRGGQRGLMGTSVGAETISKALARAADDDTISAIVVRINSPGGSAFASDQIWREIKRAADKKPLLASIGDVGASGGYYVASAAHHIMAQPATMTGSIGIVLFKPNLSGLLGRLGIGTETLARGRYARIMDVTKGLDRAELALIRTQMDRIYRLFLKRVATGRGMEVDEADEVGGGRVWTGRQALDLGLIDELGGLGDAIALAAARAGVDKPHRVKVRHYPEPGNPLQELLGLGSRKSEAVGRTLLSVLGGAEIPYPGVGPGLHALAGWSLNLR